MKVCFCTNIWNHHQGPVARELAKLLGPDNFRLFVYQPLDCEWSRERIAMGWSLTPPDEPWIIGPPWTQKELATDFFQGWIEASDVLVYGDNKYFDSGALARRLAAGKLTFKMGERLCKNKVTVWDWLNPRFWRKWVHVHNQYNHPSLHYLTMSHWCSNDLRFFRACKGRVWRWGYLTDVGDKPIEKKSRKKIRVGWCGRFLDWKNVADILLAVFMLADSVKNQVEVVLVGDGPEKEHLIAMAHSLGLDDIVTFVPFMTHRDVMCFMEGVDVFPFPSNRLEGWGAILPEAMNKCCAVVASEDAGSSLELVKTGINGFTYKTGDAKALSKYISVLVKDADLRYRFGLAAWETMRNWAPAVGARRFISLADDLLKGIHRTSDDGFLCGNKG